MPITLATKHKHLPSTIIRALLMVDMTIILGNDGVEYIGCSGAIVDLKHGHLWWHVTVECGGVDNSEDAADYTKCIEKLLA